MEFIGYLVSLCTLIFLHSRLIQVAAEDLAVLFTVEEGISAGLEVGSLGDDDVLPLGLDPGVRVALKYGLLPKGYPRSSLFRVGEDSGQIFTREKLDRESLCGYDPVCDLDIQVAVQSAISQFFKKVKVTIRVSDINDNEPTFPRQSISLTMLENVAVGSAFPLEEAEDLDLGVNGVQLYEFLPTNDGSEDFFSVNLTKSDVGRNVVSRELL
ncbi:protocadherin-1-like [Elysia marginata]|uniref:Protocadherin-1-like n=1 Tax=Elysia marginata TaxID=1093978 RepID=A0AAV4ICJ8_9GAST|nr:protocadherin-1-like [Elysia marginata]